MEGSAYLVGLLAGILFLVAGIRLLRLSCRTGQTPERLLGTSFVLAGTSYVLYAIPIMLALESLWTPLNFAGRVTFIAAVVPLLLFTRRVFRRDEEWSGWLVGGLVFLMVMGVGCSVLEGDWEGVSLSNRWFWFEWVGYTLPSVWVATEGFRHYRAARRRLRVGLSDPLICNRFLLWGVVGILQVSASLVILPMYSGYAADQVVSAWTDALLGACEILAAALVWLVFFPPAFYRNWIGGLAPVADVAEGS